jgi:hypothetical protein
MADHQLLGTGHATRNRVLAPLDDKDLDRSDTKVARKADKQLKEATIAHSITEASPATVSEDATNEAPSKESSIPPSKPAPKRARPSQLIDTRLELPPVATIRLPFGSHHVKSTSPSTPRLRLVDVDPKNGSSAPKRTSSPSERYRGYDTPRPKHRRFLMK